MDFVDCTQVLQDEFSDSDLEDNVNKSNTQEVAVLKYISGPSLPVLNYPLFVGQNIIGRSESCTVCINNQTLSKQHAMIEIDKKVKSYEICDLGSSNKTRRGKIVLKPNVHYNLVDEEYIRFADIEFQFLVTKDELPETEAENSDTASESMFVEDALEAETSLMLKSSPDDSKTKSEKILEKNSLLASFSDIEGSFTKNTATELQSMVEDIPPPSKNTSHMFIPESDKEANDEDTDVEDADIISGIKKNDTLIHPNKIESCNLPINSFTSLKLPQTKINEQKNNKIDKVEKLNVSIYEAETQPYEEFIADQPNVSTRVNGDEETFLRKKESSSSDDDSTNDLRTKVNNKDSKPTVETVPVENVKERNVSFLQNSDETEQFMATQLYVPSDDDDDDDDDSDKDKEDNSSVKNLSDLKESNFDNSTTDFMATQLYVPSPEPADADVSETNEEVEPVRVSNVASNNSNEENLAETQLYEPSQQIDTVSLADLATLPYSLCVESGKTLEGSSEGQENRKLKEGDNNNDTASDSKRSLRTRRKDHTKTDIEKSSSKMEDRIKPMSAKKKDSFPDIQKEQPATKEESDKSVSELLNVSEESDEKLSHNLHPVVVCTDVLHSVPEKAKEHSTEERTNSANEFISQELTSGKLSPKIVTSSKKKKKTAEKQLENTGSLTATEVPTVEASESQNIEAREESSIASRTQHKRSSRQSEQSSSEKKVKLDHSHDHTLDKSPIIRRKMTREKEIEEATLSDTVVSSPVFGRWRSPRQLNELVKHSNTTLSDSNGAKNTVAIENELSKEDGIRTSKRRNKSSTRRKLASKTNEQLEEIQDSEINGGNINKSLSLSEIITPLPGRRSRRAKNNIPAAVSNPDFSSVGLSNDKSKDSTQNASLKLNKKDILTHSKNLSDNGSLKVDPLVLVVNKSAKGSSISPYIIQKPQTRKRTGKTTSEEPVKPSSSTENISKDAETLLPKRSRKAKGTSENNKNGKQSTGDSDETSLYDQKDERPLPLFSSSPKEKRSKRNASVDINNVSAISEKLAENENFDCDESHQTVRRSRRNSRKTENNVNRSTSNESRTPTPRKTSATQQASPKSKGRTRGKGKNKNEVVHIDAITVKDTAEKSATTNEVENKINKRRRGRRTAFLEQENTKDIGNKELSDVESSFNQREQTLSLRQFRKKYNSKDTSSLLMDDNDKDSDTSLLAADMKVEEEEKSVKEKPVSNETNTSFSSRRKRTITPSAKLPRSKKSPTSEEMDKVENQDCFKSVPATPKSGRGRRKVNTPVTSVSSMQEDAAVAIEESSDEPSTEKKRRGRKPKAFQPPSTPVIPRTPTMDKTRKATLIANDNESTDGSAKFIDLCANIVMPKVMFTGVADEKAEKVVNELGGKITTSVTDCTHLVTDKVRRTFKFLCLLARGKPIVSIDWIQQCNKTSQFVDASKFLVKDAASEKQYGFSLRNSLEKACEQPLLKGFSIHVTSGVKPEPAQMKMIIECAGGEYLTRMPASNVANRKTIVVSCTEDLRNCSRALAGSVPVVSSEFILTGILKQSDNIESYCLIT